MIWLGSKLHKRETVEKETVEKGSVNLGRSKLGTSKKSRKGMLRKEVDGVDDKSCDVVSNWWQSRE